VNGHRQLFTTKKPKWRDTFRYGEHTGTGRGACNGLHYTARPAF